MLDFFVSSKYTIVDFDTCTIPKLRLVDSKRDCIDTVLNISNIVEFINNPYFNEILTRGMLLYVFY